jgi:acetylornithine/succinyldiaminopimelate/putrescine aminotransferase
VHLSNLFRHPYTEQVATRLCALTDMSAAFFTNSGTEAMECALKLARKAMHVRGTPERTSFVALTGGFHGRSMGALSLTHSEKYRKPFQPLQQTSWVAPDDIDALAAALRNERPCAFVAEPIQGEGGIRPLSTAFLQAARELCTATGTLLVHDEIQSGCGRTGRFLAAQEAGVTPDVVTLAKPIAAGLPMGACLATPALADTFQKGEHGSTFAGGPLVCRAALVFLREVENGLLDNVAARGAELRAGHEALQRELQIRLAPAGVVVEEARLTHLAYAPEVAQAMLRRQQAEAVLAARQKIVQGAVSMVETALAALAERNVVELDAERKAAMVSNLMVVLCGDSEAKPVINTGTLYG